MVYWRIIGIPKKNLKNLGEGVDKIIVLGYNKNRKCNKLQKHSNSYEWSFRMVSMNDVAVRAAVSQSDGFPGAERERRGFIPPCVKRCFPPVRNSNTRSFQYSGSDSEKPDRAHPEHCIRHGGAKNRRPGLARLVDEISPGINRHFYHLMLVKLSGRETSIYDLPPCFGWNVWTAFCSPVPSNRILSESWRSFGFRCGGGRQL